MLVTVGLALCAFIGFLVIGLRKGWATALFMVALTAMAVFPRDLGDLRVFGAAVTTQMLALAVIAVASIFGFKNRVAAFRLLPLVAFMLVMGWTSEWPENQYTVSGTVALLVAVLGWVGGTYFARARDNDDLTDRTIAITILLVIGLQAAVTILQSAGFDIFSTSGRIGELTEGRASGTYPHPGTLGKNVVFLALFLLPLTRVAERNTRRIAYVALILCLVPIGLSQSRANFFGIMAALGLWFLLLPRTKGLSGRIALPISVGVVGLLFLEPLLNRFSEDPLGGQRERFLNVALTHIPDNLWFGVGPSGYVNYFGQFDSLTAQGWPVHNVFLLVIAELGLIGALLLFIPILIAPSLGAIRRIRSSGDAGVYARVILTSLPPIIVLGTTGWGLASTDVLPFWMFTIAYLNGRSTFAARREASLIDLDVPVSTRVPGRTT